VVKYERLTFDIVMYERYSWSWVSDSSNTPSLEIGIEAFYLINGQLYLMVKPLFLLTPKTANMQLGLTPMSETLFFITAATTLLFYMAFFTIFRISGFSLKLGTKVTFCNLKSARQSGLSNNTLSAEVL
jgi:hypothetical protein